MATRCKMRANWVKAFDDGSKEISMSPVVDNSEENKEFFKYTPGGRLDFYTVNPNVVIEQGKEYYVDISPVP